ncbi:MULTISPECIES: hypothetical protein [Brevundimonas]|jgi:hypothetical protein|uniref:Uncharacterized protein n=1 Tax=Brevundimonas aurantiaca TaxID=74316 RepID=A0A7W9F8T0_9CAUL|nr:MULTISPECIES: hypothetical protein [Brevundimonas]MED5537786.1 hypothetical protein [Pseudomonadota bacterium]MAL56424.1 hypothetical protein [Brevundimonas sp.]MBA4787636.1 hypothetical protein [Brevundimonas sp.]MBB5738658.1 hypothetical protein [Brevundimonas aurantiaca]MBJ7510509.1 hypothetical protein [Brevundimonas sp.]
MIDVAEEGGEFRRSIDLAGTSRFRRIAGVGPVYEVTAIVGDRIRACLIDSDEAFDYPLADAENDPLA